MDNRFDGIGRGVGANRLRLTASHQPPGWENEKGNMRHPSNDKILIHGQENDPHYLSTKGRSMYHFASDQLLQKEDNTRDIWYFSAPTLTVRQMYAQEQPNQ